MKRLLRQRGLMLKDFKIKTGYKQNSRFICLSNRFVLCATKFLEISKEQLLIEIILDSEVPGKLRNKLIGIIEEFYNKN
ncbi:hypothetical protein ACR777_20080 [Sphingobacterium spiritivorum]|uniref:hypothetical protein n=1 Tax=Sphingobacterium spiritivorum TaxID=258 RepID=UPI003DA457B4